MSTMPNPKNCNFGAAEAYEISLKTTYKNTVKFTLRILQKNIEKFLVKNCKFQCMWLKLVTNATLIVIVDYNWRGNTSFCRFSMMNKN